jgi:polysaccharide pyruvyl transferase WcaK-like protein
MTLVNIIGILPPVGNKGDEAIYITSINLVKKYLNQANLAIALPPRWYYDKTNAPYAQEILEKLDIDKVIPHPLELLSFVGGKKSMYAFKGIRFLYYHSPPELASLVLSLKAVASIMREKEKVCVNVTLSFPFESANILYVSSFIIPKRLTHKPLIAFPISAVFIKNNTEKDLVKIALSSADVVFTRGPYTTRYFKKLGVSNVVTGFDPAFLLESHEDINIKGDMDKTSIGITPHSSFPPIILSALISQITEKLESRIYIIPTDVRDFNYARAILDHNRQFNKFCKLVDTRRMSAQRVKAMFSKIQLLISFRVHPIIFALSLGKPVIAVASMYDLKFLDVLSQFGLEKNFIDREAFILKPVESINKVISIISEILDYYPLIEKNIMRRIPNIRFKAELPGLYLKAYLE